MYCTLPGEEAICFSCVSGTSGEMDIGIIRILEFFMMLAWRVVKLMLSILLLMKVSTTMEVFSGLVIFREFDKKSL